MLTLEEAIIHCEEIINTCSNQKCAKDHEQLQKWLIELKERRDKDGTLCNLCNM